MAKSSGLSTMISVVIPLYNGAPYIRRSVSSVLSQTYANFELVIVDDGSVDGGGDLVREFKDSRIRLVRQQNAGVSAARNRGISETSGDYIAFLDADDEWDPVFLDAVMALSNLYPQAGIFGTGYRMIFPKGPIVEVTAVEASNQQTNLLVTDYFYRASGGGLINSSGVMIPRKVFAELGSFMVGERWGEDLEMWARIALHYPIAYDTRIMFSFHQIPIDEKPRFIETPRYDPKVKMLSRYLNESYSGELPNQKMIRSHIRHYLTQQCFWHVLNAHRTETIRYLDGSEAAFFVPLLNKIIKKKYLWPFMRIASRLSGYCKSRAVMKCTKGQRVSHSVLHKLGIAATNAS